MKILRTFLGLALIVFASAIAAQQAAAPYTQATRYNAAGQVTGTIAPDPDGTGDLRYLATRNTYGPPGSSTSGMLVKVETGQLNSWANETVAPEDWDFTAYQTKTFAFDDRGRKVAERVIGSDNVTIESLIEYSYDAWDRVQCRAVRMNPASFGTNSPSACVPGTGVFGPDRVSRYTYNIFDQVVTEERAVGTPLEQVYVHNTYDLESPRLLIAQTDANGNRTVLDYDDNFRLEKRFYPSPTTPGSANSQDYNEYWYDKNGNVTREYKRDRRFIDYEYDGNNRLVFKNLSDNTFSGDIAYDYDLRGLTLATCFGTHQLDDSCSASGAGETNTFDGFGNLISRISRMGGVTRPLLYQHDLEGNRTRVTHPDAQSFSYGFDGLNRFCSLSEGTTVQNCTSPSALVKIVYRSEGGRGNVVRTGGATTTIAPDNALRLANFTQDFASSASDLTNGFNYNPASQVTDLSQSNTLYTYSEFKSRAGTYVPNGLNQYTNVDDAPLGYDANGNLTGDGAGADLTTYTYDMENRLVVFSGKVDAQNVSANLVYDVLGRLAQTTISAGTSVSTQLHYDGDALIGEYVGGTLTRRYVHGDQVDEPLVEYSTSIVSSSTRRFLHADHQGSIIAHSNSAGAAVQTNSYDAYGIPTSTNDGRFGYTGQTWLRQLGLNYYKARIYSPRLGRFLQTDPIFYKDDMNLYAYVGNDPTNKGDPSGLASACFEFNVGCPSISGREAIEKLGPLVPGSGAVDAVKDIRAGSYISAIAGVGMEVGGGKYGKMAVDVLGKLGKKFAESVVQNVKRFIQSNKVPARLGTVEAKNLPSGGVAVQATKPGDVPESKAVYEKQIDADGTTTQSTKTTYDPDGNIVNVKDKLTGEVFTCAESTKCRGN